MIKGLVSIIIPIVKNDPFIDECVDAIKESSYKNYEIIIVDEGLERSNQRNIGINRAKGEYLLILDADMMISDRLIEDCVFKIKDCDAIYIPEKIVTPGWFGRLRDWERQFYTGTVVDVPRFVRADDCPFFDERLIGPEDADWGRRLGDRRKISDYPFYHYDKIGIIKYLRKKAYYAKSMRLYKEKWPYDKVLTFKYRCFGVFTENGKWKLLIRNPGYAILLFILLFLRGVIFLCVKKY